MKTIEMRKIVAVGIILLFLGTYIIPAIAQNTETQSASRGTWLYVGGSGPGNYTRIQDAVDNASAGDTVFVYNDSSPYYENMIIDKSIHLIGENRFTTIIDGSGYTTILITASNVSVESFTIRNASNWNNDGIMLQYCSTNMISDCDIYNNGGNGIRLYWCNNTMIFNCSIHHNNYYYGIFLIHSSGNTIGGCNLSWNVGGGVCLWVYSNNNTIVQNLITKNGNGIRILRYQWDTSTGNRIYHNNFINNSDYNAFDNFNNYWDNGYLSGGNYWDDYSGDDVFWGQNQERNGSDGVGDIPYNISGGNNTDRYPLMFPYGYGWPYPYQPVFLGYIDILFEKENLHHSEFHDSGLIFRRLIQVNTSIDELHLKFVVYMTIEMNYSLLFPFTLSPLVAFGMQVNNYTDYSWNIMKLKHHGQWIWNKNISQEITIYPKDYNKGDELLLDFNISTIHIPGLNSPGNKDSWEKLVRIIYNIPMLNQFLLKNWLLPILASYNLNFQKPVPAVIICFQ